MIDIKKINNLDKSEFLSIFGNVFEKSKWISEKVFNQKPFKKFSPSSNGFSALPS